MEDFSVEIDWNKIYREGIDKIVQAANVFIPASESITSPPQWELAIDRQLSLENENTAYESKPPEKRTKTFIPGKVFFPKGVDSCLTKKEQAVCVRALQLYQSGRSFQYLTEVEQQCISTYMSLQSQIKAENVKFLEYVKNDWQKRHHRAEQIKATLRAYAIKLWEQKLKRSFSYPQFYMGFNVIPLTVQEDESQIAIEFREDILHLGTIAKFSCPTLTSKCILEVSTLPPLESELIYNSKLPVSQDAYVKTLIDTHNIDVVISMSTLKKLLDDSNFEVGWDIPVVITPYNVKLANGIIKSKNAIYIDKPLPKQAPSNIDFNEQCHKRLVKTNLCYIPDVVHPNSETTRTNPNFYKSDSCEKKKLNEHGLSKDTEKNETEDDSIRNESVVSFSEAEDEGIGTKTNLNKNMVHHNVTYSIWNINQKDKQNILIKNRKSNKDINFLVRSKVDACEHLENGTVRPVVVVPKLEYQLEHGANIPTKSELIRQWTDLFFRPYSHLYRVRMQSTTSEIVAVESVSLQKINTEANTHYKYKPCLRTDMLYTLFSVLDTLQPGNYMLHHTPKNGPFVELLKEVDRNDMNTTNMFDLLDLHKEYNQKKCQIVSASNVPWCPIDVSYVLPVHSTFKRMPGMFKPLFVIYKKKPKFVIYKKKPKKKQKAAKKKKKGGKSAKKGETPKP